jgi:hypothetical protein
MLSALQYTGGTHSQPTNGMSIGRPPQDETARLKQEFTSQFYEQSGQLKPEYKRLTYNDGSEYVGQVLEGRHGRGVYTFSNGDVYLGFWKEDRFHGDGIYLFAKGDRYQGKFTEGRKHGRGVYQYRSGAVYDGEWLKDRKSGFGMHFYGGSEKY